MRPRVLISNKATAWTSAERHEHGIEVEITRSKTKKMKHVTNYSLLSPELADIAQNSKKGVIGRLFSRRSNSEKYEVGSPAWAAFHSARLRNPVVKDITDIQPWMYYDRLTSAVNAAPAATLMFFTTPLSSTKTKLDTNLKQASRLPDPKHFLVTSLRFVFSNMFAPDIEAMIVNYYIELWIGDKIYAEGHFDLYPGGAGVDGAVSSAVASPAATSFASNGTPHPFAVNQWGKDQGIHILQGQTFQVLAVSPAPPTLANTSAAVGGWAQQGRGLNVRAVLDGILYREVQ
jgi:hypothetical protein